jgi:hypothetical protein
MKDKKYYLIVIFSIVLLVILAYYILKISPVICDGGCYWRV